MLGCSGLMKGRIRLGKPGLERVNRREHNIMIGLRTKRIAYESMTSLTRMHCDLGELMICWLWLSQGQDKAATTGAFPTAVPAVNLTSPGQLNFVK